jgi:hypothetical protein
MDTSIYFVTFFLLLLTIVFGIFTYKSFKSKKEKWLLVFLSMGFSGLLIFTIWTIMGLVYSYLENRYYAFNEINLTENKYYKNGELLTGVTSFLNNKDSVVMKIKDGGLDERKIYLTLDKKNIELTEYYYSFELGGKPWLKFASIINEDGSYSEEALSVGKLWNLIQKDSSRTLNDFILVYGEPSKIEKEDERTFYSFLIEEESSECTDKRSFVGKASFEKPYYFESGCVVDQKLITESKEQILSKIKGKYFVARSFGSEIGTLEIKYDNTFVMFSKLFGGSVSEGKWEIYDGDDVGQANIILYPSAEQVAAGNIASEIYLVVNENDLSIRVRGSETIYELEN